MPSPDLVDYVVRLRYPGRSVRSILVRAADETAAVQLVVDATDSGTWQGWTIADIVTVAEAMARRAGVP